VPTVCRFGDLLASLRPCFTGPTFDNWRVLVYGWVLARRHTICGCLAAVGDLATKHYSTYHRTMSAARWRSDTVGLCLAKLILTLCRQGVCGVLVDDTTTGHGGPHIFGTGYHRDAVRSKPARKVWCRGHCWVVVTLLIAVPHCRRKFALPVLARLYLNEQSATKERVEHEIKPALAVEMIRLLATHFPQQRFHLCGDTNYGGASVLAHLPETFELTSRLMPQTALHQPLERLPRQGRGRPRKYGPRLPELAQWAKQKVRRRRVVLYGHPVGAQLVAFQACLHRVPGRIVQVVVVKPRRPSDKPQYFYTTDLTAPPEAVVETIVDRWPIETCFRECKQFLGLDEPQCRSRRAVERTTPLAFWCYTLTVLWFVTAGHQQWTLDPPRWYTQKQCPSFEDMLNLARRQGGCEYPNPCEPSWESENSALPAMLEPPWAA